MLGSVPVCSPGHWFASRRALYEASVHRQLRAGICGRADEGAESGVLSGGYTDPAATPTTSTAAMSSSTPAWADGTMRRARRWPISVSPGPTGPKPPSCVRTWRCTDHFSRCSLVFWHCTTYFSRCSLVFWHCSSAVRHCRAASSDEGAAQAGEKAAVPTAEAVLLKKSGTAWNNEASAYEAALRTGTYHGQGGRWKPQDTSGAMQRTR